MRLTRNRLKRIVRRGTSRTRYGPEGPMCLVCAGRVGYVQRRQTMLGRIHAAEIREALS